MTKTKAAVQGGMSSEAFRTLEYSNFEFVSSFGLFYKIRRASDFSLRKRRGPRKSLEPLHILRF
jgi:hypothetical protein